MSIDTTAVTADFIHNFFACVDAHDFDRVESMLDPECEIVAPGFTQVGAPYVCLWMAGFFATFPDLRHRPRRVVVDGNEIAFELHVTGTHTEDLPLPDGSSIPPTGRSLDITLGEFWTLAEGRVKNYTVYYDHHDFLTQMSALDSDVAKNHVG
ncbi:MULTISPECIES: ester cyclase [unclassified Rhodococcus (in: high G+C Gram-positive bacteria)]|uniref:ester cyclase n=1 Tax=unclassified Rhodococcus (in: high G+C Gram-positive bacteria) TaxID=192944 RepID=UPI0013592DBC|nr:MULTISPECIES: nuclear transport factor 2 family protein [unclassified Rhodococcus (in: high G+C Gram-positive bacteria)]